MSLDELIVGTVCGGSDGTSGITGNPAAERGFDRLVAAGAACIDAAAGAVEEVARLVGHIRSRWPRVRILLRADSGFCREALMAWCEHHRVDFVFGGACKRLRAAKPCGVAGGGLARNPRLVEDIAVELIQAEDEAIKTGRPARRFRDFRWSTRESWSRRRRVIAKAEWTGDNANPRFIVTSLAKAKAGAPFLYEEVYCARGDMENRIKECQADLFADRTSAATMRANQLRLCSPPWPTRSSARSAASASRTPSSLRRHPPQSG